MTEHLLAELAAGPVIDRLVAEEVMGWTVVEPFAGTDAPADAPVVARAANPWPPLITGWNPSRDLRAAAAVLKHLMSEQWNIEIRIRAERHSPEDDPSYDVMVWLGGDEGHAVEYSQELAICKAAILYVRADRRTR